MPKDVYINKNLVAGGENAFITNRYIVNENYDGNIIKAVKLVNFLNEKTIKIKSVTYFDTKGVPEYLDLKDKTNYTFDGDGIKAEYKNAEETLEVTIPQFQGIIFHTPKKKDIHYCITITYYVANNINVYIFDENFTDGKGHTPTGAHEVFDLKGYAAGVYGQTLIMRDYGSDTFQSIVAGVDNGDGEIQALNKPINASSFSPYEIYFYGNEKSVTIAPGTILFKEYVYVTHENITARHTLNIENQINKGNSLYLKGSINNGKFTLDADMYSLQIPKEENGFVYIYVGETGNGTFNLASVHPIYMYKDGHIQLYSEKGGDSKIIQEPYFEFYTKNGKQDISTKMNIIDTNENGNKFHLIDTNTYSINDYSYDIKISRKGNEFDIKIMDWRK